MSLRNELDEEIKWRTDEIGILKTIAFIYPLSEEQRMVIQRHSIPAIYSLWQGFVSGGFKIYINYINSLRLAPDQLHKNILTHSVDAEFPQMKDGVREFEKQIKFVLKLKAYLNQEIQLSFTLPDESNVNFKTINKILSHFNLSLLSEDSFYSPLKKLLHFRNTIAHGDYSIPIEQETIDQMGQLVIDLMSEVALRIEEGYTKKSYLA
jgi:hypothetical protein